MWNNYSLELCQACWQRFNLRLVTIFSTNKNLAIEGLKINVCIFIRSLLKGGAEKQSIILAKYLCSYYRVHLVVLFPSIEPFNCAKGKNLNIYQLQGSMAFKIIQFYFLLKRKKIDTLFCYLPSNNIIGGIIGRLAGVKNIFGGIRGSKVKNSKIKMLVQKIICNSISKLYIANSVAARDSYINYGYKASKIIVVPNMIDVSAIERRRFKSRNCMPIKILSVGRFVDEKDYDTALRAIELLKDRADSGEFKYNIVGYGPLKNNIIDKIRDYDLGKYIEMNDGQKDVKVERFFADSDIFLITSKYEGMPNSVMEAMLHCLPVVGTNAGDIEKLTISGRNGFLCRIGDYKEISINLLRLIKNKKLRQKMGIESYNILKEQYSIEKIGKIYRELLDSYELRQSSIEL